MKPHLPDTLFLQTTSSTNSYLSDLLSQGAFPHGYCVCSRFQSAGRGQAGNIWESADGENLLFSLLLHTQKFPLDRQFLLSEVVSIAICRFLSRYQISARIKYPNDIFVGNKKICKIEPLLLRCVALRGVGIALPHYCKASATRYSTESIVLVSRTKMSARTYILVCCIAATDTIRTKPMACVSMPRLSILPTTVCSISQPIKAKSENIISSK